MASYTINNKTKRIFIERELSTIEQQIISMYIGQGYIVSEKNSRNTKRIKEEDIRRWFEKKKDNDGLKNFIAKKDEKIIDKNGKKRKGGYLIALKWFKENYKNGYKEITLQKNK